MKYVLGIIIFVGISISGNERGQRTTQLHSYFKKSTQRLTQSLGSSDEEYNKAVIDIKNDFTNLTIVPNEVITPHSLTTAFATIVHYNNALYANDPHKHTLNFRISPNNQEVEFHLMEIVPQLDSSKDSEKFKDKVRSLREQQRTICHSSGIPILSSSNAHSMTSSNTTRSTLGEKVVTTLFNQLDSARIPHTSAYKAHSCWSLLCEYVKESEKCAYWNNVSFPKHPLFICYAIMTFTQHVAHFLPDNYKQGATALLLGMTLTFCCLYKPLHATLKAKERMQSIYTSLHQHPGFLPVDENGQVLTPLLTVDPRQEYGIDGFTPLTKSQLIKNINKAIEKTFTDSIEEGVGNIKIHPLLYLCTEGILHPCFLCNSSS